VDRALAHAARRRFTPDDLDDRARPFRPFRAAVVFRRLAGKLTAGLGIDASGGIAADSAVALPTDADGIDGAEGNASRRSGPSPKASRTIAPYQFTTASAACSHT
jgi:hypothetical protein